MDISRIVLLAQGDGGAAPPAGSALLQFLPMLVGIFLIYFFLIHKPQKQEQLRRRQMLDALKKNDHIITSGGIYGVVTNIRPDADEVTVRVDESNNTKLRIARSAIARVISGEGAEQSEKDKEASRAAS